MTTSLALITEGSKGKVKVVTFLSGSCSELQIPLSNVNVVFCSLNIGTRMMLGIVSIFELFQKLSKPPTYVSPCSKNTYSVYWLPSRFLYPYTVFTICFGSGIQKLTSCTWFTWWPQSQKYSTRGALLDPIQNRKCTFQEKSIGALKSPNFGVISSF